MSGRFRGSHASAWFATLVLLLLAVALAFVTVQTPPALLGVDVAGGHVSLQIAGNAPEIWWGPFENSRGTKCPHGVEAALSGGLVDVLPTPKSVTITAGENVTVRRRCFDMATNLPRSSNGFRQRVTTATLPFTGHLLVGDQAIDRRAIFGQVPADSASVRSQTSPSLIENGSAWARVPGGGEKVIGVHPGDKLQFYGEADAGSDYGLLIIDQGRLRTVAWARGSDVVVQRWGQGRFASELVAPSPLDRIQATPLWALATLAGGLAIGVASVWATHFAASQPPSGSDSNDRDES